MGKWTLENLGTQKTQISIWLTLAKEGRGGGYSIQPRVGAPIQLTGGWIDLHKSGNKLSLDLHKSGNELSLDLHTFGNDLSLDLHKFGNELSLDLISASIITITWKCGFKDTKLNFKQIWTKLIFYARCMCV